MKPRIKTAAIGALLTVSAGPAPAQDAPPPNQCEMTEHFNNFDFWVGVWSLWFEGLYVSKEEGQE